MSSISDTLLTSLSNSFGTLAVLLIVCYQFIEVNAKREAEAVARGERPDEREVTL